MLRFIFGALVGAGAVRLFQTRTVDGDDKRLPYHVSVILDGDYIEESFSDLEAAEKAFEKYKKMKKISVIEYYKTEPAKTYVYQDIKDRLKDDFSGEELEREIEKERKRTEKELKGETYDFDYVLLEIMINKNRVDTLERWDNPKFK